MFKSQTVDENSYFSISIDRRVIQLTFNSNPFAHIDIDQLSRDEILLH